MAPVRLLIRSVMFFVFLLATALIAVAIAVTERITGRSLPRAAIAQSCFRAYVRCLGLRVTVSGQQQAGPALYLSNHISWTDIPVLGSLWPLRFLSKAEVASWPVIGWLSRQAGTLYIRRGGGEAAAKRQDIAAALRDGESVLIFPEGTTSSGLTVLPFFPRLIGAAINAGVPIVPVSIAYLRNGEPCHLSPFIGDDGFHQHAPRIMAAPGPEVRVICHPAVVPLAGESTRDLSNRVREVILQGLKTTLQDAGVKGLPAASSSSDACRTAMMSRSK
ncbi:lysophospholipid acyltransferase family protein [uncultured Marinobacter sp.]|uniref:lysophospholipid acyltransferase family protein n=1 Tax=uncultured Marinobacter sp. TaxID=187379 RepID=UPI0030DD500B